MHHTATIDTARSTYEGVESLERFSSRAELDEYRRGQLERAELETSFIRREVGRRDLHVMELGMGGGRVLISLALAKIARSGIGIDISRSRVEFARQWARDLGLANFEFIQADALEFDEWPTGEVDLGICMTQLLGYLGPIRPGAPAEVFRRMYRSLAPDGCLLLELYQLTPRHRQMLALNDNHLRLWMELPEWDRFAYYLSDLAYDPSRGVLRHEKTFIGRDRSVDKGRVEENTFFTRDEVLGWLRQERCDKHRDFRNYAGDPYSDDSTRMVFLLGAPQWEPPARTNREETPGSVWDSYGVGIGAWC